MNPRCFFVSLVLLSQPALLLASPLSELETQALQQDAGLQAARLALQADRMLSPVAAALDDPKLKLTAANLPLDGFDFNAEPMTQAVVGYSQAFPAGDTRPLRREKAMLSEQLSIAKVALREKTVLLALRKAWLGVWFGHQEEALLNKKSHILSQLQQAAEGQYGAGKSSQREVANIALERAQVEEALLASSGLRAAAFARLSRWVEMPVVSHWPDILPDTLQTSPTEAVVHPSLLQAQARSHINELETDLLRQRYRSRWSIETSYGYREGRSDFVSVGVSMSLPHLRSDKNDAVVAASDSRYQAAKAWAQDQQRQLEAMQAEWRADALALAARIEQFSAQILPQSQRLEALVEADYAAGRTDFLSILVSRRQTVEQELKLLKLRQQYALANIQLRWLMEATRS